MTDSEINVAWSNREMFDMQVRLVLVSERFLAFVWVKISEEINWENKDDTDAITSEKRI